MTTQEPCVHSEPVALVMQPQPAGVWLGVDFGFARTGVAIGNTFTRGARPLLTLKTRENQKRFEGLAKLIASWRPVGLVLGLPTQHHMSSTMPSRQQATDPSQTISNEHDNEHELAPRVRRFARQLEGRFGLPVLLVDEAYTTAVVATSDFGIHQKKIKKNGEELDAGAAAVILQSFFDQMPRYNLESMGTDNISR